MYAHELGHGSWIRQALDLVRTNEIDQQLELCLVLGRYGNDAKSANLDQPLDRLRTAEVDLPAANLCTHLIVGDQQRLS